MRNTYRLSQNAVHRSGRLLALLMIAFTLAASVSVAQDEPQPTGSFSALSNFRSALKASNSTLQPADDFELENESIPPLRIKSPSKIDLINEKLNAKRLDSIYNKMDLLKKLIADEDRRAEEYAKDNAKRARNPTADINSEAGESISPKKATPGPFDPVEPADPELPNPDFAQPLNPTNPIQPGPAIGSGTPVVTNPVNSIELANSLFRTGNFAASRKSFEASLKSDLDPAHVAWIKCFVGCCYRMEGNFEKAEFTFREVTNSKHGLYAVDFSKWSLTYIALRQATIERYKPIEAEINRILKELKTDAK